MEFREKLHLLRQDMSLSQEQLANKLEISRQSVTKWENGQSFPDIQNLIRLSDIFKVSVDRLVREDDSCMAGLLSSEDYPRRDVRSFLVRAKKRTYAAGKNEAVPSRKDSHDFSYAEGEYLYLDSYFGSQNFIGQECVRRGDSTVWAMNYCGHSLDERFDIMFLKEALSLVSLSMPYRGPEFFQKGDFMYQCQLQGDFDRFTGEEIIYCRQQKVYTCTFHGGSII